MIILREEEALLAVFSVLSAHAAWLSLFHSQLLVNWTCLTDVTTEHAVVTLGFLL